MIQRIQSAFLLVVVFLSGLLFLSDFSYFEKGIEIQNFSILGVENAAFTWPLALLNFIILAIALATIFLYKKRMLQIRLCIINIVLSVGIYALMAYYIFNLKGDANVGYNIAIVYPFINIVLTYLAIRGIGKDEALIRSLDRLR